VSSSRLSFLNIVIAIAGIGLLVFTVQNVGGWNAVVDGVAGIGWWFGAIVLLGAFRMVCRTRAWMVCIDSGTGSREPGAGSRESGTDPLRFRDAFRAWIAADAVGNLTPLGLLASEPTKILMVRSKISTVTSIASVTIENAFYTASVLIVLLSGTWLFLQRADVPAGLEQIAEVLIAVIAVVAIAGVWIVRTQPAVLSKLAPFVTKLAGKPDAPAEAVLEVESRIYAVPRWPIGRIAHVVAWETVFHIAAIAEVWLVLRLLVPDITVAEAFLLESTGRFVTVAFKFVPYRLGIDEAGSGAVATVLGLPPATGVTLALVRRLRIIVLNAIGLAGLIRK
jgi:hypothetical protein